jgi:uncharacterized repeat protein (TIGR02543 family)
VVSEVVKVRRNLTSAKIYNLGLKDLNLSYLITFNLNGGAFGGDYPAAYRSTDADLTLPEPGRLGYEFKGWHAETSDGADAADIPQGSTGDKHFYAKWTARDYTITYNNLYGAGNTTPPTYTIESDDITLAKPTHATYRFIGWYDNDKFTEPAVTSIPTGSTGPKTFYARWKPPVTVGITLQLVPDEPELTTEQSESVFAGDNTTTFNAGSYDNYQWYWNGEPIDGATNATYTLKGTEPEGIHELSVVVSDEDGETLSARCKVTIKGVKE